MNSSDKEQRLLSPWKLVDVVLLPKQKPVEDLSKQFLPISLTPAISPWLFLLMFNDLKVNDLTWKYVDDTTISQTIPRGSLGDVQHVVTAVEEVSVSADAAKLRQVQGDGFRL